MQGKDGKIYRNASMDEKIAFTDVE